MTAGRQFDDEVSSGRSTSQSLLADAKRADPRAWERLVKLYAPLVASWCRRWGVDEQDVTDVLQEVFVAVAGHLDRFRKQQPSDTFRGWLLTIARNKTRDHFRRKLHEPAGGGGTSAALRLHQVPDPAAVDNLLETEDEAAFDGVLLQALESIRDEFQERTWKAFWGVAVEGRSAADVAADLGMQPGTVRVAKSRVLTRLRHELGDVSE